jgi:hypothetical protein
MHDNHARFTQGKPLGWKEANKEARLGSTNVTCRDESNQIKRPQHDSDSNVATTRWNYMKAKNHKHQTGRNRWEEEYISLRHLQFHNFSYKQLTTMFA